MRVLFIRSNPVSPDSRLEKEVNTLINAGHNVTILCWDRDSNYQEKKEKKELFDNFCDIYRIGIKATYGGGIKMNFFPLIKFQYQIVRHLKSHKDYEVIHACDFDTGFISYLFKSKKFFVYDIYDYYAHSFNVPNFIKKVIEFIENYLFNHSDYSIICSEKRLKQISNIKTNKICIIHNSPMKFEVKDYKFQFSNRVKIVYVGILGENRMIRELVEVVKKDSSMELHIGGFGPLDSFISDASNKYENIVFYGKIPYQKTIYLEQKCDIIPALYSPRVKNHVYAAPNKFYEAGFLGKPTIMIKNSGMSELVDSNHLGLTIEDNKESLRNALAKIVNEIDYWKLQSETIKEYYEINFSWEEMSKRLVYLYDDLEKDKC